MPTRQTVLTLTALMLASCSGQSEPIHITGSSTVYPFTQAVASRFAGRDGKNPQPEIESIGTIAGMKAFCAGPGAPDILDASRRMTRENFGTCQANRTGEILEIVIGLDGIALAEASAGQKLSVTAKDLYLALAATPFGKANAAKTWRDVNPKLPDTPIKVLGPPASSGTRDSFLALILEPGCVEAMPDAAKLRASGDPAKFDAACRHIRSDGPYVDAGEDDNATVKALERDPTALGVFGYSYLEQNARQLRAVPINGVSPDANTIARGQYAGVRQLYLYVKKAHIGKKPAIKDFLTLYAEMRKPGGPLTKDGLIPLSDKAADRSLAVIENGYALEANDLS